MLLLILALAAVGYAIYRSTDVREEVISGGRQFVYGEPQHGLILGLCILAGICILSTIPLMLDRRDRGREEVVTRKRTLD